MITFCTFQLSSKFFREKIFYSKFSPIVFRRFIQMTSKNTPVEDSIRKKLREGLNTAHLDVINDSYMHDVPRGSETHFRVVVVSDKFQGLRLIQRHRMVNKLLKDELTYGIHALSIVAKTPEQWSSSDKNIEPSPKCRGGFGK